MEYFVISYYRFLIINLLSLLELLVAIIFIIVIFVIIDDGNFDEVIAISTYFPKDVLHIIDFCANFNYDVNFNYDYDFCFYKKLHF